jgi:uroporphyrinogen III methyltransferase / synthase
LADSRKPSLAGKRIVATRAPEQAGELVRELNARGAEVLLFPMVRFAPPEDWAPLDKALQQLNDFDAVIFLSANAVRYVFERCRYLGVKFGGGERPLPFVAAIGPTSERALVEEGSRADYVGRDRTGESLAKELAPRVQNGAVLLPRSDRGNEAVSVALRKLGAHVTEVTAYRTALPEKIDAAAADRIKRGDVDVIMFASPSAVQNFVVALGGEDAARIAKIVSFAAIGPTTAQSLRDANLPVTIQAAESSAQGLAEALARFYTREPAKLRF